MGFIFTDRSGEVIMNFNKKVERGLEAIGRTAVGYAKKQTPVDTGRLRNSEDFKVNGKAVYIGTNVKYAPYQEFGTSRGIEPKHFLKNAAANHGDEYRNIMEASLKS